MTTPKFDLHTIDYSVQGWDAILATDMEKIDDSIPTRLVIKLGETVAPFKALYLNTADNKWYKAQANGVKQPCWGLSIETGDAEDDIRIHRMGEITNPAWAWANIGSPIYLDPTTPGELTQTKPAINIQIIGYALEATKMVTTIEFIRGVEMWALSRGGTILNPTPMNILVWRAPFPCTVKKVWGYRHEGTGGSINARRNGTDKHLSADLSLDSADVWTDGGAVQNTAYAIGDKLEIMIVTETGEPTQIAIQVDFDV